MCVSRTCFRSYRFSEIISIDFAARNCKVCHSIRTNDESSKFTIRALKWPVYYNFSSGTAGKFVSNVATSMQGPRAVVNSIHSPEETLIPAQFNASLTPQALGLQLKLCHQVFGRRQASNAARSKLGRDFCPTDWVGKNSARPRLYMQNASIKVVVPAGRLSEPMNSNKVE